MVRFKLCGIKGEQGEFHILERYLCINKIFGGFVLSDSPWLPRNLKKCPK